MDGNETQTRWMAIAPWTALGAVVLALFVYDGDSVPFAETPCLDPDAHSDLAGLHTEQAVAELEARRTEATRRAAEHRRAAQMFERDERRNDPEQRQYVDEAFAASQTMVDEYETAATTAADMVECLEGG